MSSHMDGSCIKCKRSCGLVLCNGCQEMLCFEHIIEHKIEIDDQLEKLIEEENIFEKDLLKNDDSHKYFNEIDQWKKESIEKIKQISKQTKEDLRKLILQSNEKLLNHLKLIKENLYLLKESKDYSEIQINKLTKELKQLKEQIHSFQLIKSSSNSNFLTIQKEEDLLLIPSILLSSNSNLLSNNNKQIHSKQEGSIMISEIDPYGHYIIIRHNGITTDKDQDMIGWILKRSIDSYRTFLYRFPNDFYLKSNSSIKILSREASQTRYLYEKSNCLIADSISTWGIGIDQILNILIDANGNERDILIQTFK